MKHLLTSTAERAVRYLEQLEQRSVAPSKEALQGVCRFDEMLPEQTTPAEEVIGLLDQIGSPATMAMAGRRYFGFVIGGSLPVSLAADWMTSTWDQNTGLHEITPMTATLERITLGWLLDLLGLPADGGGAFVTGATVANFTALAAARHLVLEREGWDVEADGLMGAPPIKVVVGEEAHPTLFKSLGMLGLGRNRVIRVPVDGQGRMRTDALAPILATNPGPTIVCTQAGNINTGAFDPIGAISDLAHQGNAWVHVDGAFGLWAAVAPSAVEHVAGMERADSWATDAHKTLNVPYDSGLAFVRYPEALRAAMAITAEYLPQSEGKRNPSDFTPELSRRARGINVWAALRHLGRRGVAELVEGLCSNARRMATGLSEAGFEILNDVVFNQVLVSLGTPEETRRGIAAIQQDGTAGCGGTEWQGRTAMRISISSWATTQDDVDRTVTAIKQAVRGG